MLVVQHVTYLRPSKVCNLMTNQVIRLPQGSGASSWALFSAPQGKLKGLEHGRVRRNRSVGRSSFGHARRSIDGYTADKTAAAPLLGRSQARYAVDFGSGRDHGSSVPSPVSVAGCALTNTVGDGNSKNEANGTAGKASGGTTSTLSCSRKSRSCQTPRESLDN